MNRFALEMKVESAEISGQFDRRLEETNGYNHCPWAIRMRFAVEDWQKMEHVYLNGLKVTLLFRTFKIEAVMVGYYRVFAQDILEVTWQSISPLRPL